MTYQERQIENGKAELQNVPDTLREARYMFQKGDDLKSAQRLNDALAIVLEVIQGRVI